MPVAESHLRYEHLLSIGGFVCFVKFTTKKNDCL